MRLALLNAVLVGIWVATLGLHPRTRSGILREALLAVTLFPGLVLLTMIPVAAWQTDDRWAFLLGLGVWLGWMALAGWGMHRMLQGQGRVLRATVLGLAWISLNISGGQERSLSLFPDLPKPVSLHAQRVVFREWGGEGIRLVYGLSWKVMLHFVRPEVFPVIAHGREMDTLYLLSAPDSLELIRVGHQVAPRRVPFPALDPGVDTVSFFVWAGETLRWRVGVPLEVHLPTRVERLSPWRTSLDLPKEAGDTLRAVLYLPVPSDTLLHPVAVRIPAGPSS